jgi:mannose/fructose/N-acetylgalactosamine-specific phosphotransferase system component IIB
MKKIIFRVDDRLIHGQVIEGWLKHFKINHVIIANDKVSQNPLQKMIYASTLPPGTEISILSIADFIKSFRSDRYKKDYVLVLLENVDDLYAIKAMINSETYVNIGCVACREHKIEVSNTVFLNPDEIKKICEIRQDYEVFIHKVAWEPSVEIKNFNYILEGNL